MKRIIFDVIDINNTLQDNLLFDLLSKEYDYEHITKGRLGCIIVSNNDRIPIVRTTTKYNNPMQTFSHTIMNLINVIKHTVHETYDIDIDVNNIMAEIYDDDYKTMGFHSDQALDLADESYIIIYSCYDDPTISHNMRKLIVKGKNNDMYKEIYLTHNSIVIFDTNTNKEYLHKIVLNDTSNQSVKSDKWLGLTMRLSKTFIKHDNDNTILCDSILCDPNKIIHLASVEESKEFYKLRSCENKAIEYTYPEILYTISPNDLLPMKNIEN